MTLKAKPVVKRAQRPGWESQDRRNFLLNVGFGLVVLLALVLLLVAAGLSWYNDHLAPVGSVDGESITRDELRDRFEIESWRLDEAERRIRTAVVAGYLSEADGQSQLSSLADARNNLASLAMERVIDTKLQAKLAVEEGISVTDADVDAQLLEEATSPEQRHAWVIEVAPELDPGAIEPTPAQRAAARALADKALADLEAGTPWEEVAETTSTDTSTAGQGGDLGWIRADDTQFDAALLTALFAAEANVPSEVIEGDDGTFRIGRVTEIVAETVDGERISITGYEVIVTKIDHDDPHGFSSPVFDVHVPADRNSLSVSDEFLEPGTEYVLEVLALERSGNQTITVSFFTTS